jgi:hypothetical protein
VIFVLTLAKESLGGNTKTTLIVTCSPHAFNAEETVSTMQFGQRAKTIKNKVQVNKQLSVAELEAELKNIQKEYNACKLSLAFFFFFFGTVNFIILFIYSLLKYTKGVFNKVGETNSLDEES